MHFDPFWRCPGEVSPIDVNSALTVLLAAVAASFAGFALTRLVQATVSLESRKQLLVFGHLFGALAWTLPLLTCSAWTFPILIGNLFLWGAEPYDNILSADLWRLVLRRPIGRPVGGGSTVGSPQPHTPVRTASPPRSALAAAAGAGGVASADEGCALPPFSPVDSEWEACCSASTPTFAPQGSSTNDAAPRLQCCNLGDGGEAGLLEGRPAIVNLRTSTSRSTSRSITVSISFQSAGGGGSSRRGSKEHRDTVRWLHIYWALSCPAVHIWFAAGSAAVVTGLARPTWYMLAVPSFWLSHCARVLAYSYYDTPASVLEGAGLTGLAGCLAWSIAEPQPWWVTTWLAVTVTERASHLPAALRRDASWMRSYDLWAALLAEAGAKEGGAGEQV